LDQLSNTRTILTAKTHHDHIQISRKILGALRHSNIFRLSQNQPSLQHTLPNDLVGCVFAWINHPKYDQFSPQKRTATISSFPAKSSVRYGLSTFSGFPKPWPQHTLPDDLVGCVFAWINHPKHDQFSPPKRTATISSFPAKSSVRYGLPKSSGFPKINRGRNTPYRMIW
jgi:hypothetical protein